jgi:outer membrane protein insertion porin family
VTEGERFVVSSVKLEGNYLEREDEFKSLVTIRRASPTTPIRWCETTKAFTEHFGNSAYAFARRSRPCRRSIARTTVWRWCCRPTRSRRAYVRRIKVAGNNRTRDEVVRREFRQFESAWYDGEKIRLSRDRVDRLGFFTEVSNRDPGGPWRTGPGRSGRECRRETHGQRCSLGAGFSSAEKVSG